MKRNRWAYDAVEEAGKGRCLREGRMQLLVACLIYLKQNPSGSYIMSVHAPISLLVLNLWLKPQPRPEYVRPGDLGEIRSCLCFVRSSPCVQNSHMHDHLYQPRLLNSTRSKRRLQRLSHARRRLVQRGSFLLIPAPEYGPAS